MRYLKNNYLKSNMDRFIGQTFNFDFNFNFLFKIQYG